MQSQLTSVRAPRWGNPEHTFIECDITTSQFGAEVLPFTARPDDVEPHGRELFQKIVAGEYGPIAEYQPPAADEPTNQGGV